VPCVVLPSQRAVRLCSGILRRPVGLRPKMALMNRWELVKSPSLCHATYIGGQICPKWPAGPT